MTNLDNVVLDTSVFVNPHSRGGFGPNPTSAFSAFLDMAARARNYRFFMPPSVFTELLHFVDLESISPARRFIVIRKPPRKLEVSVPAFLMYELIQDVRRRIDKGLRVAEEALRRHETLENISGESIATLRGNYRKALREGIIDSTEDVDLVLLARELDGILVSADQGVLSFADKLGVRSIDAVEFLPFMGSVVDGSTITPP